MTRKILTVSLTIALVAALIGGATMAWLSAKADLPEATLTAGTVNIEAGQSAIRHLGFTPGQTPVVGPEVIGNYAFIPNANEASVSKVDLAAAPPAEVARYSTVQPRSAAAYGYPVYRVSRLAMDSQGNAWVLNSMTGTGSNVGRQGSVVRISGSPVAGEDTTIPNTSIAGGLAGMLDSDVRVTVFDVGAAGDCPRTINIVEEGSNLYLWIGFYMTEYFEKFAYDPVANTLASTGQSINVAPYNAYTAVIDGNGILWGVSRNASPYPSPSGTPGVFYFDTNNLGAGVTGLGYSNPGGESNPYAILLKSDGTVWVSDGGNWSNSRARYFAVYTWGTPVTVQYVDTGVASPAMRGFMEDGDGNIWATSINGLVIKLTWDGANWTGATMISGLGELTGLGADAYGWFWVIQYGSDQMTRFDPDSPTPVDVSVALGDGPYAYGNFVQFAPPSYKICGYKFADWFDDAGEPIQVPLPDWEITLQKVSFNATLDEWIPDLGFAPQTTTTDAEGKYCFADLEAGNYTVCEVLKDGWKQVSPEDCHLVELPDGATDLTDPNTFYNFVNTPEQWCGDQTAWAAQKHPGETRFSDANNWATYVTYERGSGNSTVPALYPLYAGQHYLAGILYVYDEGDTLYVQYTTEIPQALIDHCIAGGGKVYQREGYCAGEWTGFFEYHLAVGNTEKDIPRTMQGRGRNGKLTNPIPGRFAYKDKFDSVEPETEWIKVDISKLTASPFVIAAHAVMQWCGYDCRAVDEIEAALL